MTDEVQPFRYAGGAALYGSIGRDRSLNVSGCSYRITKCCLGARDQSRAHNFCGHFPGSKRGGCSSCQPTRLRPLLTPRFGCSAGLRRRASMPDRGNDRFVGADARHSTGTLPGESLTRKPPIRSGGGHKFPKNRWPFGGAGGFHPAGTHLGNLKTLNPPIRSGGGRLFFAYSSICPLGEAASTPFRSMVPPPSAGLPRISTTCAGRRAPLNMGRAAAGSSDDWLYRLTTPAKVPGALPRCRSGVRGTHEQRPAVATPSSLPRARTRKRFPG